MTEKDEVPIMTAKAENLLLVPPLRLKLAISVTLSPVKVEWLPTTSGKGVVHL